VDGKAIFLSVYPDHYDLGYDFKGAVRRLAEQAQVADKVDWKAVDKALADRDGIFADVAITSQVAPTPRPAATASP
jgi:hypothetical protein